MIVSSSAAADAEPEDEPPGFGPTSSPLHTNRRAGVPTATDTAPRAVASPPRALPQRRRSSGRALPPKAPPPNGLPPGSLELRARLFPKASDDDWADWRWQLRNRLSSSGQFERALSLTPDERAALDRLRGKFPTSITPFYASLLDPNDAEQPLRRSMVPRLDEFTEYDDEREDPLGEEASSPVEGLVHRYPDRVLFLVSDHCAVYCRYCTRARVVGSGEMSPNVRRWETAFEYLESHPEIRDVLISGGDPLTLSDDKLDYLLTRLRSIPHIEFVRLGTKVPAALPQRITPALTAVLRKHHPLWMSLHFTHPGELVPEVIEACERLADAGIPLGSQTVLLAGVNDDAETLRRLFHGLLKARVRPYYLYQCDPITGSRHFRTPIETGLRLIQALRGHTTGYAVPQFVIDAPGGGGKIPLQFDAMVGRDGDDVLLRNYEGRVYRYPDPLPRGLELAKPLA